MIDRVRAPAFAVTAGAALVWGGHGALAARQTAAEAQLLWIILQIQETAKACHVRIDGLRQAKLAAILRRLARKEGADTPAERRAARARLQAEYRAARPAECAVENPAAELARTIDAIRY